MSRRLDQFCAGFATGDAISNEAMILQAFARKAGFGGQIYADHFPDADASRVRHSRKFRPEKSDILIYHHSIHTPFSDRLPRFPGKKILLYHNVTPSSFVRPYHRALADRLDHARSCLKDLTGAFDAVLADSAYNAADLETMGFVKADVMPVALRPIWEQPAPERAEKKPLTVLFVGRVFPNKRHQDLLKAFYFLKRIRPDARLQLVGSFHPEMRAYTAELNKLIHELGLTDVEFTGMVNDRRLIQAYRDADVFLSMSEHEGFFVPLIECMHFGVPILAFASSVIPETLGQAGVLFNEKRFPEVAEMLVELAENSSFRSEILQAQKKRAEWFSPQRTTDVLGRILSSLAG